MVVLSILVSVSLGFLLNSREGARVSRAEADMQVIQQGLEKYRARFGDYPRIPTEYVGLGDVDTKEEYLLNALFGRIGPAHQAVSDLPVMLNSAILEYANKGLPISELQSNWIVDPWGEAYFYDYQPDSDEWVKFGYELYSAGPDGEFDTEDDILAP